MKRFVFTMQTLLNVKNTMEKQHKAELAECSARLDEFRRRQEDNYAVQLSLGDRYREALTEGLRVYEIPQWQGAFIQIREQIAYQAKVIEQAEAERERVQRLLVETMRERKMLETLRDKQYEEYKSAQRAEDAAVLDDYMSNSIYRGGEKHG